MAAITPVTASAAVVSVAGLAGAIAARAQVSSNQFEIRRNPPEPGCIDVRLDVDRDGQATSHVTAMRAISAAVLSSSVCRDYRLPPAPNRGPARAPMTAQRRAGIAEPATPPFPPITACRGRA